MQWLHFIAFQNNQQCDIATKNNQRIAESHIGRIDIKVNKNNSIHKELHLNLSIEGSKQHKLFIHLDKAIQFSRRHKMVHVHWIFYENDQRIGKLSPRFKNTRQSRLISVFPLSSQRCNFCLCIQRLLQWKSLTSFVQLPPFWHGCPAQSSTSKTEFGKSNNLQSWKYLPHPMVFMHFPLTSVVFHRNVYIIFSVSYFIVTTAICFLTDTVEKTGRMKTWITTEKGSRLWLINERYNHQGERRSSLFRLTDNRVLLSKALSCDRLPEEIWCSQQILAQERSLSAHMKFEHQISEGTCHT